MPIESAASQFESIYPSYKEPKAIRTSIKPKPKSLPILTSAELLKTRIVLSNEGFNLIKKMTGISDIAFESPSRENSWKYKRDIGALEESGSLSLPSTSTQQTIALMRTSPQQEQTNFPKLTMPHLDTTGPSIVVVQELNARKSLGQTLNMGLSLEFPQRHRQNTGLSNGLMSSQGISQEQGLKSMLGLEQNQIQRTTLIQKTVQPQIHIQQVIQAVPTIPINPNPTFTILPPPTTTPNISFGLPDFSLLPQLFGPSRSRKVKFNKRYSPSLTAEVFNIKGPKPSDFMISTGLGIRPMLR
jgi:hypothetical protein